MPDNSPLADDIAYQIDFNFHQVPSALAVEIPDEAAALMLKLSAEQFKRYADFANVEVHKVAADLAQQPDCAAAIRRIKNTHTNPVSAVLTVGDSITTYRYGYAELLGAMLAQVDPQTGFTFMNVGRSGYTSTHGLEHTFTQYLQTNPDWVVIKYGVNDTKCFGGTDAKTLVSLDEYRANLDAIVGGFCQHTRAHVLLMTPTPVLENVVNNNPEFIAYHMTWRNADIEKFGSVAQEIAGKHGVGFVDLFSIFTATPDPALLLSDGLHPSLAGQQRMLEVLLRAVQTMPLV